MTTKLGDWIQQQSSQKRLYILRNQIRIWAKGKTRVQRMKDWLTDWGFLEQKLGAVGITALIDDYDLLLPLLPAEEQPGLKRIQGALQLSAHVLAEDNSQLAGQLLGRLLSFSDPEILTLLQQAKQWRGKPWFRPLTAHLTPPGGPLLRTFTGHSDGVNAVAITPDGKQAVSASYGKTLKLWDLATGSCVATLCGHSRSVNAVAITPSGKQAVSASEDNTLKLWDLATGEVLATFTRDGARHSCGMASDGVTVVAGDNSGRVYFLRLEGLEAEVQC
jgi:WD40 repeat protein